MYTIPKYHPEHFRDPEVASLAWAIASAPLMSEHTPGYAFVSEEWCTHQYNLHHDWLMQLDKNPQELHAWLVSEDQKLLGKRFESLLAFWFHESKRFNLLARNVVLKDGKNTRGEIDFIVQSHEDALTLHIEAACKYYIGLHDEAAWKNWIGPNGTDSLLEKMNKLKFQESIFRRPDGLHFLHENNIEIPNSCLFMKGYFFHHFQKIGASKQPKNAHPHCNSGWHISLSEIDILKDTPSQWILADRRFWMAPYHFATGTSALYDGETLIQKIKENKIANGRASMLIQVREEQGLHHEISRAFILPHL